MNRLHVSSVLLLSCIPFMLAAEVSSAEPGEKLFNSTALGSNGRSCATCHPGGMKLQGIDQYDDEMLKEMINFCIRDALQGEMLKPESAELNALLEYVKTIKP